MNEIIEIKTSSEILHECAENVRKRLPSILSSEYENRKWINMDDLLGYLDDINYFQSPALIRAQTIIDLIELHSKNSRSSDENALNKGYEVNQKLNESYVDNDVEFLKCLIDLDNRLKEIEKKIK